MRHRALATTALACGCLAPAAPSHAVLIHHYTFDEADIVGVKGAADVAGSTHATPTGAAGGANITTGQTGVFGQAYAFVRDTTGDAGGNTTPGDPADFENTLRLPVNSVPFGSAQRTIALWFNQTGTDGQQKIFGYGSPNNDADGTTGEALDIGLEAGGIRLRNFNGNITYGSGFDFTGANAGWNHLAVRVNPGATTFLDLDVLLNGNLLTPTAVSGDALNDTLATVNSPFGIANVGYDHFMSNGFTGLLDDLRIYNNALNNSEIAQLALPPGVIPGDTDNDGDIDGSDMLNALSGYTGPGGSGATPATGDTDLDGDVDDTDFALLIANYTGPLPPAAASVPEPASALLLAGAAIALTRRRKDR